MVGYKLSKAVLISLGMLFASSTFAIPLTVQSYDMQNGDTGSYNYWDDSYNGSGNNELDRALLSGGTGDLTDGIIAAQNWYVVEPPVGAHGPYVGWYTGRGIPSINFHFGELVNITSITLYADDSDGAGGVRSPGGVNIGSSTYLFDDPIGSAPNAFTISGLDLTVTDLSMDILGRNLSWIFVSEITFDGTASVPEPSALALLILGLLGLRLISKRKS